MVVVPELGGPLLVGIAIDPIGEGRANLREAPGEPGFGIPVALRLHLGAVEMHHRAHDGLSGLVAVQGVVDGEHAGIGQVVHPLHVDGVSPTDFERGSGKDTVVSPERSRGKIAMQLLPEGLHGHVVERLPRKKPVGRFTSGIGRGSTKGISGAWASSDRDGNHTPALSARAPPPAPATFRNVRLPTLLLRGETLMISPRGRASERCPSPTSSSRRARYENSQN